MAEPFLVGHTPDSGSRLPYVLRLPLADGVVTLATRDRWPGTRDLFCLELDDWPDGAEVVEEVPVSSCRRHGASIRLILARRQRRRSLFVWTRNRQGRVLVFWRSERSMRGARPGARMPSAQGLDGPMTVAVDTRERYPWRFSGQPVTKERRSLPVGDYAVFDGERLVAAVERKRADEFAGDAVAGTLALTMAELATLPRAAVIVEGRLSDLLEPDVPVRKGWLLNLVASLQASHPNVPLLFAETPKLAGDLAHRWLAACAKQARGAAGDDGPRRAPASAAPTSSPEPGGAEQLRLFEAEAAPEAGTRGQRRRDAPHGPRERRERALRVARDGQVWTTGAYAAAFGVSTHTARTDLKALAEAGALEQRGRMRASHYVAAGTPCEPDDDA